VVHSRTLRPALSTAALLALAACSDITSAPSGASAPLRTRASRADDGRELVTGQVIVRYRPEADRPAVAARHGGKKKEDMLLGRTEIVEVPLGEEEAVAAELANDPDVEFAEPDWVVRVGPCEVSTACNLPDGQFLAFKWDLNNGGNFLDPALGGGVIATGKADADIDWAETYDRFGPAFTGSAVIGILDTGIRPTHSMFTGKILGGQRFLNDGLPLSNYIDDHGHGSHVAGIAAGRAGAAVPGVAYGANVKLLIGKVCNSAGSCPTSATANAIVWAADNGANVINMSLGSFGGAPDGSGSPSQQAALQYAASKNVLAVCATGNDDGKPEYSGGVGYPARFPECMAVAATNWSDGKASYSNYGPQTAISAPGGDGERSPYSLIVSASRSADGSFAFNAGTSMATPQVAGVAAMLWATGMHDASAIRARIMETADDLGAPGRDPQFGAGRVNLYRAITGLDPNAPPVPVTGAYTGSEGVAVAFSSAGSADPNGKAITYLWNFGDGSTSTAANPTHTYVDNRPGSAPYDVTLTVTDASNRSASTTVQAAIANAAPVVAMTSSPASTLSGGAVAVNGSFTDLGAADALWHWVASATDAMQQGDASSQGNVAASLRVCSVGAQTVRLSVTDKDGAAGSGTASVSVLANAMGVVMPATYLRSTSGKLPVSLLGSTTLDARTIDPRSVMVARTPVVVKNNGTFQTALEDVNRDGRLDLTVFVSREDIDASGLLVNGANLIKVTATLTDGCKAFAGSQSVNVK